jgi:hypothetical protein
MAVRRAEANGRATSGSGQAAEAVEKPLWRLATTDERTGTPQSAADVNDARKPQPDGCWNRGFDVRRSWDGAGYAPDVSLTRDFRT